MAGYFFNKNRPSQYESDRDYLNRARDILASVINNKDMIEIPQSNGMRVLSQIPGLDFIGRYNLVLPGITQRFWEACIRRVTEPDFQYRICAMGIPGIGKTSSTPFLIRMLLLKQKHTVVYRRLGAWHFWEFAWKNEEDGYVVTVYPQDYDISGIHSLNDSSTFYIVDPGSSRSNCAPDTLVKARTIIVSSPDACHWGYNNFGKRRGSVMGRFMYFPLWSLKDILMAQPYFLSSWCPDNLSEEKVTERFRQVGGVPSHIFLEDEDFQNILQHQNGAVDELTAREALRIVEGNGDAVGSFESGQPKTVLIGYSQHPTEEVDFSSRHVTFVSHSVAERIAEKFIGDFWNLMLLKKDHSHWSIFGDYCRRLMNQPARSFQYRPYRGKKYPRLQEETYATLGDCTDIRMTSDLATAVINSIPMTLFHSVDPQYPLIDFIYKDSEGMVHAFQPTLGKTHDFDAELAEQIRALRKSLGNIPLTLYYMIPGENFQQFVTNPIISETDELTQVGLILIPNPKNESHRTPLR